MNFIPTSLLKNLYTIGSLRNEPFGFSFAIKNRLTSASLILIRQITVNDTPVSLESITIVDQDAQLLAHQITASSPLDFPLGHSFRILIVSESLPTGDHQLSFDIKTKPFGRLTFSVGDQLGEAFALPVKRNKIPRDSANDYHPEVINQRQQFAQNFSQTQLQHITQYSFNPQQVANNCEHFTGVAQVPIGLAGPIKIKGEHAQGEFLIPLATTEGTLVASYNRGIKLFNSCGGITCTVVDDGMQRAPVFELPDARHARQFARWITEQTEFLRHVAQSTSSHLRLKRVERYTIAKFVYLRFIYSTGDAAGQNMVSKATFEVCQWILDRYPDVQHFYLESNMATDKKYSQINTLLGRGKRVTAEITIPKEILKQQMGVTPVQLQHFGGIANLGSFAAGASSNSPHAANALAALFIATGQDVANVAESSAVQLFTELTTEGDFYACLTLPSLIVATYGGGTSLATQRECLELMDCYGQGQVQKFAEIVAGVVAAGEISLAAAITSLDWVASHEQYGRNR
ncbi:MAG: hydroxymethylglutaryl-CoA reductase [Bacteroidota bacterium]